MYHNETSQEKENKRNSFVLSAFLHVLMLLLVFLPIFASSNILDNQFEGIVVAIGVPDAGNEVNEETESAAVAETEINETEVEETEKEESKPTEQEDKIVEKEVEKPKVQEATAKSEVEPKLEVEKKIAVISEQIQEKSPVIASKEDIEIAEQYAKTIKTESKSKAEAELKKAEAKKVADKKAKVEADAKAEAKAKAEKQKQEEKARQEAERQEAERKEAERQAAAAKAQKLEDQKDAFGDLFGKGSKGEKDGDKGVQNGDPNSSILEGMSTGSGRVGEGLDSRGVVYAPDIKDNSQKTGKIAVKVCVNKSGKVVNARYTQKGSTTTDQYLVNLAEKNAAKYTFTPSTIEEQCGVITINFLLE